MHYIVGLGNPGKEYSFTRHNVGFLLAEWFVTDQGLSALYESGAHSGRVSKGIIGTEEVTVLLPSTHMNASGSAVNKMVPSGHSRELMVIYDDVDLPLGELKISFDRGDGGHNGIKSIRESLGTSEFARLRVGIAKKGLFGTTVRRPQGDKLAEYVLSPFSKGELKTLDALKATVRDALVTFITEGIEKTMNRFN